MHAAFSGGLLTAECRCSPPPETAGDICCGYIWGNLREVLRKISPKILGISEKFYGEDCKSFAENFLEKLKKYRVKISLDF